MREYKGIVSSTREHQRSLNAMMSDNILSLDARPEFDKWFDKNMEFGFGMGWMKGMAKKFCWWGYFAGYKRGVNK
jgi:hypothetical protein